MWRNVCCRAFRGLGRALMHSAQCEGGEHVWQCQSDVDVVGKGLL